MIPFMYSLTNSQFQDHNIFFKMLIWVLCIAKRCLNCLIVNISHEMFISASSSLWKESRNSCGIVIDVNSTSNEGSVSFERKTRSTKEATYCANLHKHRHKSFPMYSQGIRRLILYNAVLL